MRINHRFAGTTANAESLGLFERHGIQVDCRPSGVFVIEIGENDEKYQLVSDIAKRLDLTESVQTEFTEAELSDAEYVAFSEPAWFNGYPQPEDNRGYLLATYDFSEYCRKCGTGAKQTAPFRLRQRPKWGRRSIFRLNWITDEYFVPPDLWQRVFRPLGVGARPVILHKSGDVIDNVIQLDVTDLIDLDINDPRLKDVQASTCAGCGRIRVSGWLQRGNAPRPARPPQSPMWKSTQYFGFGRSPGRMIFVNHELYTSIAEIRGVSFKACLPGR